MVAIMGFDLGTKTGFAHCTFGTQSTDDWFTGSWNFTPKIGADPSLRYSRFGDQVKMSLIGGLDCVYYELVHRHSGIRAAHVYGAFEAKLHEVCSEYSTPCRGIGVGVWKKHFTGKGSAGKGFVLLTAQEKGHNVRAEDEADAIGIASCGKDLWLAASVAPKEDKPDPLSHENMSRVFAKMTGIKRPKQTRRAV